MKKQCKIDSSWKIIIFPTDTVYGIGCKITDENSIKKIYEIKHRPQDKPLACLCANLEQINQIAILDKVAKKIIKNFMPGALTLILRARDDIDGAMPIHVASANGNDDAVILLLEKDKILVNEADKNGNDTPLHWAAMKNKPSTINVLLKYGADTKIQNSDGNTALHYAAMYASSDVNTL